MITYWHDCCEHGEDCFRGSFIYNNEPYDVYVFVDKRRGKEVCIRYGNGGGDYISPGPIAQFFEIAKKFPDNIPYKLAAEIIINCHLD